MDKLLRLLPGLIATLHSEGSVLSVQVDLQGITEQEHKDENPLLYDVCRAWINLLNDRRNLIVVHNLMLAFYRRHK